MEQIAARLDRRLRLLTSGSRAALPHQQTLRASLDWSYDLLAPPERRLLRRLAVFAGGWTLEAAEAVCAGPADRRRRREGPRSPGGPGGRPGRAGRPGGQVAGGGRRGGAGGRAERGSGEQRYSLLETVRQYALEKLAAGGEAGPTQARHAAHFLALAEAAEPALNGPQQTAWLARLEREHDNLRAALRWALERGAGELGLRLAAGLWRFWLTRGHLTEGQRWLDRALSAGGAAPPAWRAKALNAAGNLARMRGNPGRRRRGTSLALRRELRDVRGVAASLTNLGNVALDLGDLGRAARLYEESLAHYRQAEDRWGVALALNNLGVALREDGSPQRAVQLHAESLALRRALGDRRGIAEALDNLGRVALAREDWPRAEGPAGREPLPLGRAGGAAVRAHDAGGPRPRRGRGGPAGAGGAAVGGRRGPALRARRADGAPAAPGPCAAAAGARARAGAARYDQAWAEGRAMSVDEAVAYALSRERPAGTADGDEPPREPPPAPGVPSHRGPPCSPPPPRARGSRRPAAERFGMAASAV